MNKLMCKEWKAMNEIVEKLVEDGGSFTAGPVSCYFNQYFIYCCIEPYDKIIDLPILPTYANASDKALAGTRVNECEDCHGTIEYCIHYHWQWKGMTSVLHLQEL